MLTKYIIQSRRKVTLPADWHNQISILGAIWYNLQLYEYDSDSTYIDLSYCHCEQFRDVTMDILLR